MPTVLNPYIHHENVLKCVDTIIYAFFAVKKKKAWSVAATGFIAPDHETYHDGYRWRALSEQSHGLSMLIRMRMHSKAASRLGYLLHDLASLSDYQQPTFLAEFWRLCIRVHGFDSHIPLEEAITKALSAVRMAQKPYQEKNQYLESPVERLCECLEMIHRSDLRHALRLGFVKTMKTMSLLIGDENIIVLEMMIFYCKYFDAPHIAKDILKAKLESVKTQIQGWSGTSTTEWVAIQYAYVYASYYIFDEPSIALENALALKICILRHDSLGSIWTLESEAFSFASKIIAELHRKRANESQTIEEVDSERARCMSIMQLTVNSLRGGDVHQKIRAALHSQDLNRWLDEWNLRTAAAQQSLTTTEILNEIPDRECQKCQREQSCEICEQVAKSSWHNEEVCQELRSHIRCDGCRIRNYNIPARDCRACRYMQLCIICIHDTERCRKKRALRKCQLCSFRPNHGRRLQHERKRTINKGRKERKKEKKKGEKEEGTNKSAYEPFALSSLEYML